MFNFSGSQLVNSGTLINRDYMALESGATFANAGIFTSNNGSFDVYGAMSNTGTLILEELYENGSYEGSGSLSVSPEGSLTNSGTVTVRKGQLVMKTGSTFTNEPEGLLDVQGISLFIGTDSADSSTRFHNMAGATVKVTSDPNSGDVVSSLDNGGVFINEGNVDVNMLFANNHEWINRSGSALDLTGDFNSFSLYRWYNGGSFWNEEGATLTSRNDTFWNLAYFSNSGKVDHDGFSNTDTYYNHAGGVMDLYDLSVNHHELFNEGLINNLEGDFDGSVFYNFGLFENSGTFVNSHRFANSDKGEFINTEVGVFDNRPGFELFIKASTEMSNEGLLDNSGQLNNEGWLSNSGTLINRAGASLSLTGNEESDTDGSLFNERGATLDNQSGSTLTIHPDGFMVNAGALTNSGALIDSWGLDNRGVLINLPGGSIVVTSEGEGELTNLARGTLENQAGATLTVEALGLLINHGTLTNNGTLVNDGLFENSDGGNLVLTATGQITGEGELNQFEGAMIVDGTLEAALVNLVGGTLNGNGTINAPLHFWGGLVSPGNSVGALTTGSTTFHTGSALHSEVESSASADQFNVNGALELSGGTIQLTYTGGPNDVLPTDEITIATSTDGITGTFDNAPEGTRVTTIDGAASFTVHYSSSPSRIFLTGFLYDSSPTTNKSPVFQGTTFTFDIVENATNGTEVGELTAIDPEGSNLQYSLAPASPFAINPNSGQITVEGLIDFETQATYFLTVNADDGADSTDQAITINVTNIMENEDHVINMLTKSGGPFEFETDPLIIGFNADPDLDGYSNVFELWLATMPDVADTPSHLLTKFVEDDGTDYALVEVDVDAAVDDLLVIIVEISFDLVTWRDVSANRTLLSDADGMRRLQFRDSEPLTSDRQFFSRFASSEDASGVGPN